MDTNQFDPAVEAERQYPMRMIAFTGPKYSGKDTASKILFEQNKTTPGIHTPSSKLFWRHPFAGSVNPPRGIKGIMGLAFGYTDEQLEDPVLKETPTATYLGIAPRFPLMDGANWFRDTYGGDVWCHAHERNINWDYKCQVITDHRFPEEAEYLDSWGMCPNYCEALILYIQNDEAEAKLNAAKAAGDLAANNPSESFYDQIKARANSSEDSYSKTVIIDNNGTIPQLHGRVLAAVRNHFGYWGEW